MLLKLENNFIFRDPRFINIYNLNKKIKNYCIILDSIGRNYYPSLKSVKNKKALSIGWIDGNTCSIRSSIDDLLNHGFEIIIQTNNVDEINFLNKRYKAVIGSKISFVDKINFNNFDHSDISIGICPHDNLNEIYVKNNELIYTKNAGSSRVMDYLFMGLDIVISDKVKFQNKIINFSGCKTINILNLKKILHKYDYKNNVRLKSRIFSVELYAKKLNKVINEIN